MKKVLFIAVICTIALLSPNKSAIASPLVNNTIVATDTIRKKIVHPKEAMTDIEVNKILSTMRQKNNDDEKVVVLKERLKDKGINMDQLIKLLNQFLSDDAKLDCAQYAFQYTTNYKQFLRIMDLFGQEGYKYRLEDFYDKNRK